MWMRALCWKKYTTAETLILPRRIRCRTGVFSTSSRMFLASLPTLVSRSNLTTGTGALSTNLSTRSTPLCGLRRKGCVMCIKALTAMSLLLLICMPMKWLRIPIARNNATGTPGCNQNLRCLPKILWQRTSTFCSMLLKRPEISQKTLMLFRIFAVRFVVLVGLLTARISAPSCEKPSTHMHRRKTASPKYNGIRM